MNTPRWFWFFVVPLSSLALLGVLQVGSAFSAGDPDPPWARTGYVTGIVGLFVGSVLLLLRRKWSIAFFIASAIGFLTHRFWVFALSDIVHSLAPYAPVTLFLSVVFNVTAILVAMKGKRAGWIT